MEMTKRKRQQLPMPEEKAAVWPSSILMLLKSWKKLKKTQSYFVLM